jgi:hypothetical protein
MKATAFVSLLLFVMLPLFSTSTSAQQATAFHVAQVAPYDKAVPGQIMELLVEGLEGGAAPLMLPPEDFKLTVSQDGVSQNAKIRTVTSTYKADPRLKNESNGNGAGPMQMRNFQSVSFVVPQGLHTGDVELMLAYRGKHANSISMTIVEKPLRPAVGTVAVITVRPGSMPAPGMKPQGNDMGWRLERGATASLFVNPLTDPDDPASAILIRFKQGDTYYDAQTRVTNQPFQVDNRKRAVGFFTARDILEVDVPAALTMGPAEVEIRVRANGQESEAVTLKATITDSARSAEAPGSHAPRLLLVTPTRVGAGQSMLLSLDYRRTLDPDPPKTVVVIEQGSARYIVSPEKSSLMFSPRPDAPVLFFVRTTRQILGKAQIRIYNQLRGEQTGMSEPVPIEVLEEPLPPELLGVSESTETELAPLRQMYEIQARAGRTFPDFDPQRKYVTLRVKGIDYNPNYVRITFEQEGRRFTLASGDFSLSSGDILIVAQPKELKPGPTKITIENRGVDSFSAPVSRTLEICCTH